MTSLIVYVASIRFRLFDVAPLDKLGCRPVILTLQSHPVDTRFIATFDQRQPEKTGRNASCNFFNLDNDISLRLL